MFFFFQADTSSAEMSRLIKLEVSFQANMANYLAAPNKDMLHSSVLFHYKVNIFGFLDC